MRSLASDCRRWRETWRKPGAPQPLPAQVGGNTRRRPETVTRLQLPTNGGKHSANPARAASVHQSPAVDRNACTNACRRRGKTRRKPNAQQQLPAQVGGNTRRRPETVTRLQLPSNGGETRRKPSAYCIGSPKPCCQQERLHKCLPPTERDTAQAQRTATVASTGRRGNARRRHGVCCAHAFDDTVGRYRSFD